MTKSKLESALRLAKNGFPVFPLQPNSKLPAIKDFPNLATTDEKQIRSWWTSNPNCNIGISTDKLLVVDVDTKDIKKNGVTTMEKLNREGKIFPPTTQQTTTTNGAHIFYSTPYPIRNSASKLGPGLDVRGFHGFVVGAGSTINGKEYTIDLRPIPIAPDWLLEASVEARLDEPKAHEKVEGVDTERAKARGLKYLKELPPSGDGQRNADGFKIAAKLKDFGCDEADTFILMMENWKYEGEMDLTEIEHVVKSAYRYGRAPQGSESPEALFPTGEKEVETGDDPFIELNKTYAFVRIEMKHRIVEETTDENGDFELKHIAEETFHKLLASRTFQPDGKAPVALTRAWMNHEKRRTYKGLVFCPEQEVDPRYYNLWRGFSVDPLLPDEELTDTMKRGVEMWEDHLLNNICVGDLEHYNWVYGWFAHIIQKPWEKPGTALVLKGKKGVGKNALFESVERLFKKNYLLVDDKNRVFGNFNSHMEQLLLLVLDEAFWGGDKSDDGRLKSLITNPDITIERKGIDSYKMKSRLRIAMLSNEDWVVPATDDERRYAVFNVGDAKIGDEKFFGELAFCMDQGADRYLLTKLKNFDLSTVNVRRIPDTEGLQEQKMQGLKPLEAWWFDCLSHGHIDGISSDSFKEEWQTSIEWQQFISVSMMKIREVKGRATHLTGTKIINELKKFLPEAKLVKRQSDEFMSLVIPSLSECRLSWDRMKKTKTNWHF